MKRILIALGVLAIFMGTGKSVSFASELGSGAVYAKERIFAEENIETELSQDMVVPNLGYGITEHLDGCNGEGYIIADEDILNDALVEYEEGENKDSYINSLEEIYGDSIEHNKLQDIAKIQVASHLGVEITDFSNISSVVLGKEIILYDANNVGAFVGYNYSCGNQQGYITLASHMKAPLIKEIVEDSLLPETMGPIYYLSEQEFYVQEGEDYKTLDGIVISKDEFAIFKQERVEDYYYFTAELLASIELDNINIINNITYLVNEVENAKNFSLGKSYNGQEGSGYGGIADPKKYIKSRYGGTISLGESKNLSMQSFICSDFSEKNNCTLVAITRILCYYNSQGYNKLPDSYAKIYKKVLKKAKKYGYTESGGTWPTKINNIIDAVLKAYGYNSSYSKGIYAWTFSREVKNEIDNKRPIVMNIARGYYGNHSVTVCGYRIYQSKHKAATGYYSKTHNLICTYDGWSRSKRYIDYEAFAYDLISAGFGSFNTIVMR